MMDSGPQRGNQAVLICIFKQSKINSHGPGFFFIVVSCPIVILSWILHSKMNPSINLVYAV